MPPKKIAQQVQKKPDGSATDSVERPTNICDFKINMEVRHEAGHYLKVKYNWVNVDKATGEVSFPFVDTGHFNDWTLE